MRNSGSVSLGIRISFCSTFNERVRSLAEMDHRDLLDCPFAINHGVAFGHVHMAVNIDGQMFTVALDGVAVAVIGSRRVGRTFVKHLVLPDVVCSERAILADVTQMIPIYREIEVPLLRS